MLVSLSDLVIKMSNCEECGKKLGFIEGYRHPTLGRKHHLCGSCFDQVSESVKRWGEFVLSNSFVIESSNNGLKPDWKKIATSFNKIHKDFPQYLRENGNLIYNQ